MNQRIYCIPTEIKKKSCCEYFMLNDLTLSKKELACVEDVLKLWFT